MRILLRTVLIFFIIFLTYTLFIQFGDFTPLEQHEEEKVQISNEELSDETIQLPDSGLLSLVDKSSTELTDILGDPSRIDPSAYDYDWWIYEQDQNQYMQVGVLKDKVVTVFGTGSTLNASPFKVGQSVSEVFKIAPVSPSLTIDHEGNSYRFEFSEEDMNTRPSVKMGEIYVQLYIDKFDGTLSSVRAVDKETFVKQRSYEVVFRGELIQPQEIDEEKWGRIESGSEKQILAISNMIRKRHSIPPVDWDEKTSEVAFLHSQDMKENNYFSHESPTKGTLVNRLAEGEVMYEMAGENIAAQYIDGIAAVEGWLNSKGHREALLNEKFTHLGVGVDELYYTQNFIKDWE